jgi:hypothetical protein
MWAAYRRAASICGSTCRPFISDTRQIIRASLLLTQIPDRTVDPKDTLRIIAHVSLATKAVTDVARAAQITGSDFARYSSRCAGG